MLEASISGTRAECAVSLVYYSTPESEVVLHFLWMKQLVVTQVKVRFVETAEFLLGISVFVNCSRIAGFDR